MNDTFIDFTRYDIPESDLSEVVSIEGNEKSDLLIFLRRSSFGEEEEAFLEKVLMATNRSLADSLTYIFNADQRIRTAQIPNFQSYQYIISIGVVPKDLCINAAFNFYRPSLIGEQNFLFVPSLIEISVDQKHKKLLWGACKDMFGIES